MLTRIQVIEIVRTALEAPEVTERSTRDDVQGWDSLVHLNILTALDEATQGAASDLSDLAEAQTVGQILDILAAKSLLSD